MEGIPVNIKKIDWLDKENPEADVLFEVKGKEYSAFCHPCDFREEETEEVNFGFLEEDISELTFWEENKEQKRDIVSSQNSTWYYYCYGQITSIQPLIIDCGPIAFYYSDWINDEKAIGSYVYFVISRLDIRRVYK